MRGTEPSGHDKGCAYLKWYRDNARWQPNSVLSELAREIMDEVSCTCDTEELKPLTDKQKKLLREGKS